MSQQSSRTVQGMNPVAKFALWMLVADILIAAMMLVITREPIPVVVTFGIIYVWSFAFLRRRIGGKSSGDAHAHEIR